MKAMFVGLAFIWTIFALGSCSGDSAQHALAQAKALIEKSDGDAAIIQLKNVLQNDPKSFQGRLLMGKALLARGDPISALVEFEKAYEVSPDSGELAPLLAEALVSAGQTKKAIDRFESKTLPNSKDMAALKAVLAQAYAAEGKIERSREAVAAALALDPSNRLARLVRVRLTAGKGSFDEAIQQIDDVLAQNSRDTEALQLKGELLWKGKANLKDAEEVFLQVIRLRPASWLAHSALLTISHQKKDLDQFRTRLANLKRHLPGHPGTAFYEAQLAILEANYKRARELSHYLLKTVGENPETLQLAAAAEVQTGSLRMAEQYLIKALRLTPNYPLARATLGAVYLRLGQPDKAIESLAPLLEAPTTSEPAVLRLVGDAYLLGGNVAKAEALYAQAAEANPNDFKAKTALAMSQFARGNATGAFAQLETIAARDPSSYADMAIVSTRLARNDVSGALIALDRLQSKRPRDPEPYLIRARILLSSKNTKAARQNFEAALTRDPMLIPAAAGLAALDLLEGRPELARKRYEDLAAKDPKNPYILIDFADIKHRTGAPPEEVEKLLVDAIAFNPNEIAAHLALIDFRLSRKLVKSALVAARDAIGAFPENPAVLDALGRAQLLSGDSQQAITTFVRVTTLQPNAPQSLLRLADAYLMVKDYRSAARTLQKALEVSPGLVAARRGLVLIAAKDRQYVDDALQAAHAIQKQRPSDATGFLAEGEIYLRLQKWDSALQSFELALARKPSLPDVKDLYTAYLVAGRLTEAERLISRWLSDHPKDKDLISHAANVAIQRKAFATAETQLRKLLALQPDDPSTLNNIAWSMLMQRKSGALSLVQRAALLAPDRPEILDTFAAVLADTKQLAQAVDTQRRVVALAPNDPTYRFHLAKYLIASGSTEDAKTELERIAKVGNKFQFQAEVAALLGSLK